MEGMKLDIQQRRNPDQRSPAMPQWRITPMRKSGIYPRTTVITPRSAFSASEECTFMVAPCQEWPEDLPFSEVMWLNAEEIRLLGSMMMTERFDGGQRCSFRPVPYAWLYVDPFPLNRRRIAELRTCVIDRLAAPETAGLKAALEENSLGSGGCFPAARLQMALFEQHWNAISGDNYLLLRGMHALIKSDMLAAMFEFREEAIVNTFIALDASFQLVLRHLVRTGQHNPSARDAGDWVYRTFDERLGLAYPEDYRYFQEFYDNRIRTLHPGSRLGDFPYAPLAADDYSHLRSVLPGIFGYMVTGKYTPEFEMLFRRKAEEKLRREAVSPRDAEKKSTSRD